MIGILQDNSWRVWYFWEVFKGKDFSIDVGSIFGWVCSAGREMGAIDFLCQCRHRILVSDRSARMHNIARRLAWV